MKRKIRWVLVLLAAVFISASAVSFYSLAASADNAIESEEAQGTSGEAIEEDSQDNVIGLKSIAVGLAIGLAAAGGGIGMGIVGGRSAESISRQPEMQGAIRSTMMLGLVFIETAIIYALLVVILIIFVM